MTLFLNTLSLFEERGAQFRSLPIITTFRRPQSFSKPNPALMRHHPLTCKSTGQKLDYKLYLLNKVKFLSYKTINLFQEKERFQVKNKYKCVYCEKENTTETVVSPRGDGRFLNTLFRSHKGSYLYMIK